MGSLQLAVAVWQLQIRERVQIEAANLALANLMEDKQVALANLAVAKLGMSASRSSL